MIATTKVICSECQHENESERVYCRDCGARLDRSAVPREKEANEDTQKRVRNIINPRGARLRHLFFQTSKMILGACGLAALIQIILPADVPAPAKTGAFASPISMDMENLVSRRQPGQLQYTEDQVNTFLTYALRTKKPVLNKPLLEFKRAMVAFGEGSCSVIVERSFFGYSLYTTGVFVPAIAEGKITASTKGTRIGRFPIHPQVGQYLDILFADVFSALGRETKLLAHFNGIEFHDKAVLLTRTAP